MTETQRGVFAPKTTYEIRRELPKSKMQPRPNAKSTVVEETKKLYENAIEPNKDLVFKEERKVVRESVVVDHSSLMKKEVLKGQEDKEAETERQKWDESKSGNDPAKVQNQKEELSIEHRNEIKHKEEINQLKAVNEQQIKALEAEKQSILYLERQYWEKQRQQLKELHKVEIANIHAQHKQDLLSTRRQIEQESSALRSHLQSQTELAKLASQVDSIMVTMRAKVENEVKEKLRAIESREIALEEERRKLQLDRERVEIEKKRVEANDKLCRERENGMKQELKEYKKLYDRQRDGMEVTNREELQELLEAREKLKVERAQLELDRSEWENAKRRHETQLGEEKKAILLEKKLLDERRRELDIQAEEASKHLNSKFAELNMRREEAARDEADLQKRQQLFTNKEMQLKNEHDELQLKVDKYCYDKRILEGEKQRFAKLALQVEEESRVIYKYKSSIDDTKQKLEDLKDDIDCKELLLHKEKAKVQQDQSAIELMQTALIATRMQQAAQGFLSCRAPTSLGTKPPTAFSKTPNKLIKEKKSKGDLFRAEDFIEDMRKMVGKRADFGEYVSREKELLLKAKRSLNERSGLNSLTCANSTARSTDRYIKA
eukprot:TRINITY_DN8722_c0_g2_i1.p1 TRINITY_DN8722_c0_g2~~TRINITY_DN8722_c0_g2_i1.p1  ORF type:complete len:607 (+),score=190.27 TRINITY_DN8722_c0_g2_i1:569-2389(+)